ncbi:MAG TPA: CDP-diacylglycerol--glycerol-3-phosphate 3-phosphatidyltransferase [Alphaproteobacteria bacterium]|nr:CDP-diacylglycerol--glycerol-3-phosphate 3-phosphatidyltransferase [Alphaproteobacteria bacterium]
MNLPNLLTFLRILLIPAVVGSFFVNGKLGMNLAFGFFVLAGITDFFDGYLARAMGQQSKLGTFLDPVADKLLVASALMMLVASGRIFGLNVLPAIVILCREILVSGLREFLAGLKVSVPVSRLAKWKTTVQLIALAALLWGDAAPIWLHAVSIGMWGLWIAAILTLYTGYDYLRSGLRHMTTA